MKLQNHRSREKYKSFQGKGTDSQRDDNYSDSSLPSATVGAERQEGGTFTAWREDKPHTRILYTATFMSESSIFRHFQKSKDNEFTSYKLLLKKHR